MDGLFRICDRSPLGILGGEPYYGTTVRRRNYPRVVFRRSLPGAAALSCLPPALAVPQPPPQAVSSARLRGRPGTRRALACISSGTGSLPWSGAAGSAASAAACLARRCCSSQRSRPARSFSSRRSRQARSLRRRRGTHPFVHFGCEEHQVARARHAIMGRPDAGGDQVIQTAGGHTEVGGRASRRAAPARHWIGNENGLVGHAAPHRFLGSRRASNGRIVRASDAVHEAAKALRLEAYTRLMFLQEQIARRNYSFASARLEPLNTGRHGPAGQRADRATGVF